MTQSLHPKTNSCQFYPHIIIYYQDVPILHPTLPFFSPGYNWWQLLKSSRISTAAAIFKGSISPTEKLSQTGRTSQNGLSILYYHIYIYYQKKTYGSPDLGNICYGSMNCGLNLWKNSSCAMICTYLHHGYSWHVAPACAMLVLNSSTWRTANSPFVSVPVLSRPAARMEGLGKSKLRLCQRKRR